MLLFINANGIHGLQLLFVDVSHTLVALINSCDLLFCSMTELDESKKERTSIALLGLSSLHVTDF